MKTLYLGAWQPEYFNQHGELANVKVLQFWLTLSNIDSEIVAVESLAQTKRVDLMLVGDASRAAIRHFQGELSEIAGYAAEVESAPRTLVLGKSFECVAERVLDEPLLPSERVSEVREFSTEHGIVRGYLNTKYEPVGIVSKRQLLGSSLHGPILASSPQLRELILQEFGAGRSGRPQQVAGLEKLLGWT